MRIPTSPPLNSLCRSEVHFVKELVDDFISDQFQSKRCRNASLAEIAGIRPTIDKVNCLVRVSAHKALLHVLHPQEALLLTVLSPIGRLRLLQIRCKLFDRRQVTRLTDRFVEFCATGNFLFVQCGKNGRPAWWTQSLIGRGTRK